jgi:hypothetical protein
VTRVGPPACGLGVGLTTPHHKKKLVTKCHKWPSAWMGLDKCHKLKKMDMRFFAWNVRSLYRAGSLMTVMEVISKFKLDLVGVQEVRWDRGGTEPGDECTFFMERGMRIMN